MSAKRLVSFAVARAGITQASRPLHCVTPARAVAEGDDKTLLRVRIVKTLMVVMTRVWRLGLTVSPRGTPLYSRIPVTRTLEPPANSKQFTFPFRSFSI